jgi:hypothetical protein
MSKSQLAQVSAEGKNCRGSVAELSGERGAAKCEEATHLRPMRGEQLPARVAIAKVVAEMTSIRTQMIRP